MTRIRYDPAGFVLRVEGHAGAGRRGRDLVCAGLSTLCWTLLAAARKDPACRPTARTDRDEARFTLRCAPEPEARERCRTMFETAAAGFELLAERFPAQVRMERAGEGT